MNSNTRRGDKDGYRRCGHCDQDLLKRAYFRHKSIHFDKKTKQWRKERDSRHTDHSYPEIKTTASLTSSTTELQNKELSNNDYLLKALPERSDVDSDEESDNGEAVIENTDTEIWEDDDLEEVTKLNEQTRYKEHVDIQVNSPEKSHISKSISYFLLTWQKLFNISNNALEKLFVFIKLMFSTIGIIYNQETILDIATVLPKSVSAARRQLGINRDNFIQYVVCPKCQQIQLFKDCYVTEGGKLKALTCPYVEFPNHPHAKKRVACGSKLLKVVQGNVNSKGSRQIQKIYLYPLRVYCYQPVLRSLESLVKRPDFRHLTNEWRERDKSDDRLCDIYDGRVWKYFDEMRYFESFYNLSFTHNIDWMQPYTHVVNSVGAIYLMINNLPQHHRIKPENSILVGIMEGPDEPKHNVNAYLRPLVEELKLLWKGVHLPDCSPAGNIYRGALMCIASDIPACRKCGGFVGHSALKGCSKCLREFPHSFGEKADYGGFRNFPARKNTDHKQFALKAKDGKHSAEVKDIEKKYGARWSVFYELDYFLPVSFHVIDVMHNIYLGTGKYVTKLFCEKGLITESDLKEIQSKVDTISLPTTGGRIPSKIKSGFSSLNADQWKNWVNICSIVCLKEILPQKYLDMWTVFVEASRILCQKSLLISEAEFAHKKLLEFCEIFEKLFPGHCTMNMHLHMHLCQCILDFGPSHATWCFPFERLNGILGKYQTNNHAIPVQMMRKFIVSQQLSSLDTALLGEMHKSFENILPVDSLRGSYRPSFETSLTCEMRASPDVFNTYDFSCPNVECLPPRKLVAISSQEQTWLLEMFENIIPTETINKVSALVEKMERVNFLGDLIGCQSSRNDRSSCIDAKWLDMDDKGNPKINPNAPPRAGTVTEIWKCNLEVINGNVAEVKEYIILNMNWLRSHYYRDFLPAGCCIYRTVDEHTVGCERYMPIQRLRKKCAMSKQVLKLPSGQETVYVVTSV